MAVKMPSNRARDHPRWKTLVESSTRSEAGKSTLEPLGPNYSSQEHTLRNDYSQHFVDTGAGLLPGNAVRNPSSSSRFDEYPKLKRLVQLKDSLVTYVAHPPTYLQTDLRPSLGPFRDATRSTEQFHLGSLIPVKYDVVLIDPPLEAYDWEAPPASSTSGAANSTWSWEEIAALPVPQLAAKESFVFLWVGSGAGDGLERGREVLAKWGYRRCEDIVCIRTNPQTDGAETSSQQPSTSSAFTRTSQHCLMGIRGTVRRSTDTRFVHCNIDTDVILWPGPEGEDVAQMQADEVSGPSRPTSLPDMISKPPELYQTIENFCLGTRRLELFGRNRNLRRGWLTIGLEVGPDAPGWLEGGKVALPGAGLPVLAENGMSEQLQAHLDRLQIPRPYDKVEYDANFGVDRPGCDLRDRSNLVPFIEEVDQLRPKSPPPRGAADAAARYRPQSQLNETYKHPAAGRMMPSGLSHHSALHAPPTPFAQHPVAQTYGGPGLGAVSAHPIGFEHPVTSTLGARAGLGGAGLSGLGAGGERTVSVQSGSDTLSGPQASVLKAKAIAEAAAGSPDASIG
uniref:Uncharacterized protein n=1 Tax=Kalmanozyma brasiliensis (strain GHG001) TaxID=1365824 RepID=V5E6M5_KALBG